MRLWIDLDSPDAAEEDAVEATLGHRHPHPRGHAGNRDFVPDLPRERGAVPDRADRGDGRGARDRDRPGDLCRLPGSAGDGALPPPRIACHFADWAARHDTALATGADALLGLLESAVDRLADILEGEARRLDALSTAIFAAHRPNGKGETLAVVLQRIGRAEDLNGKVSESLGTIQRLVGLSVGATASTPAGSSDQGATDRRCATSDAGRAVAARGGGDADRTRSGFYWMRRWG